MTDQSKKPLSNRVSSGSAAAEGLAPLLGSLRQLIADSRQQVLRAVDAVQVQTYWHIGRHIVEFEQGGAQRRRTAAGTAARPRRNRSPREPS